MDEIEPKPVSSFEDDRAANDTAIKEEARTGAAMDDGATGFKTDATVVTAEERTEPTPYNAKVQTRPSEERVTLPHRMISDLGRRVFTDAESLFPLGIATVEVEGEEPRAAEVAEDLNQRAVSVLLYVSREKGTLAFERHLSEAQAFLIKRGSKTLLATSKNNIASQTKNGNWDQCVGAVVITPHRPGREHTSYGILNDVVGWNADTCIPFVFPKAENMKDCKSWKFGTDVHLTTMERIEDPTANRLIQNAKPFEAVNPGFVCQTGMAVGILAHSHHGSVAKNIEVSFQRPNCDTNYAAQKGDTFVMVGEITYVAENYIQYDMNTVPGFSGAPVFLLDPGKPSHMKVVAVHVGLNEERETNFGFLLSDEIKKKKNEDHEELLEATASSNPTLLNFSMQSSNLWAIIFAAIAFHRIQFAFLLVAAGAFVYKLRGGVTHRKRWIVFKRNKYTEAKLVDSSDAALMKSVVDELKQIGPNNKIKSKTFCFSSEEVAIPNFTRSYTIEGPNGVIITEAGLEGLPVRDLCATLTSNNHTINITVNLDDEDSDTSTED